MLILKDIINFLDDWAPSSLAAAWDNVGLQLGNANDNISSVLVSLELDLATLTYLKRNHFDLLITHHPLFFKSFKALDYQSDMGKILEFCCKTKLALFSAHTNLDVAKGGVNDCLLRQYGFDPSDAKPVQDNFGAVLVTDYTLDHFKMVMPCRILGSQCDSKVVKKIAFCAGSGHGMVQFLPQHNIDVFVTGEVTYHDHVFCEFHDISVITVGHYASEVFVVSEIARRLRKRFLNLTVQEIPLSHKNPECEIY